MPVMYGPPRNSGFLYTALGDSLTAGYGVSPFASFVSVYARWLQGQGFSRHINAGINGLTAEQLAGMLSSNGQLRQAVGQAALITVTVGANDLLRLVPYLLRGIPVNVPGTIQRLGGNIGSVVLGIRRLNPRAVVQVAGIYNPLALGAGSQYVRFAQSAQAIVDQANLVIASAARETGGRFVPVEPWLNAERMAGKAVTGRDLIHPGGYGHQALAAAFESDYSMAFSLFHG